MKKRQLGQGLDVAEIGFGCMGLNYHRGPAKEPNEMIKVIHGAIDQGITMFDTAEVYGPYTNEELVGKALVGKRHEVQIATKGGFKIEGLKSEPDSSPQGLIQSVEGSLRRLQTDYLDLFYIHRIDPKIPIEVVAATMQQLKKSGKINHWGLSEASAETIRRAHAIEPLTAVESEYSIWWREAEQTIFPVLEELGIGLVAYSPLGRGFLTGTLTQEMTFTENDNRGELPRFTREALAANQVLIEYLSVLAKEKGMTLAQLALAWILAQKPWIVPIPGTTSRQRLVENSSASQFVLSEAENQAINEAVNQMTILGDRYPESEKQRTGR